MAVIGCGRGGRLHLAAWRRVRTARLGAVVDLDAGRAARAARDFYAPREYTSLERMLESERLDFVDVAVGVDAQPTVIRKCLEAGLHVLADSPPCTGLDELRSLVAAASARKLRLMVGYPERWRSCFRALRRAVDGGAIGEVHYARIFDRRPLGRSRPADPARPALNSLPHLVVLEGLLGYVDLLRWGFGEIASVWAATLKLNPALRGEDFALAAMRTAGDRPVNAVLDVNWSSPLPGAARRPAALPELRLEGSGGALELDPAAGVLRVRGHSGPARETPLPVVPDLRLEPYLELQGHFAECLESGREPECSGPDAVRSLEAVLALYDSARTGGLVLVAKP
jgi:predicted dehydrogenase